MEDTSNKDASYITPPTYQEASSYSSYQPSPSFPNTTTSSYSSFPPPASYPAPAPSYPPTPGYTSPPMTAPSYPPGFITGQPSHMGQGYPQEVQVLGKEPSGVHCGNCQTTVTSLVRQKVKVGMCKRRSKMSEKGKTGEEKTNRS